MSLDKERIEANLEATLQAMTIAAGYPLPKDMGLVTRELLDYDETRGRRPAAIIQVENDRTELVGLGGIGQTVLRFRIVLYYDLDTNGLRPATYSNAYTRSVREALLADRSRGAHPQVLTTMCTEVPTALLWKAGQAFEATVVGEVLTLHTDAA